MAKKMENNPTYLFVAAAALMGDDEKILVQKRPDGKSMAGLWEFPGGKVEAGETPEMALARELKEELDIEVDRNSMQSLTFASEDLNGKHLLLLLYLCREWSGTVKSLEDAAIKWVSLTDMQLLDMPPADKPLVSRLLKLLPDC